MDELVRSLLKRAIRGKGAHIDPYIVLDGLEYRFTGLYPTAIPNTIWQIAEHMHFWVDLKLQMFQGKAITMPEGHVFGTDNFPPSEEFWNKFVADYKSAIDNIEAMIDSADLSRTYPEWGNLPFTHIISMMGSHNSYHAAQVVAMRRVLGVWK